MCTFGLQNVLVRKMKYERAGELLNALYQNTWSQKHPIHR